MPIGRDNDLGTSGRTLHPTSALRMDRRNLRQVWVEGHFHVRGTLNLAPLLRPGLAWGHVYLPSPRRDGQSLTWKPSTGCLNQIPPSAGRQCVICVTFPPPPSTPSGLRLRPTAGARDW